MALPAAWRDRLSPPTRVLLAWVVPSWLLFEAVQTKLPHYTLPMFPALMLLGAAWAMDPLRRAAPRPLRWLALAAVVGTALGLAGLALGLPGYLNRRVLAAGVLALLAAVALAWVVGRALRAGAPARAALAGAALAVPLYAAVLGGVLPHLAPLWIAPRLAALLAERAPGLAARDFGITGHAEPSVLFAVGTGANLLRTGTDAARFLAAAPGRVVAVGERAERDFQAEAATSGLQAEEIGTLTGLNYTRGRWITLLLYRRAP